MVCGHCYPDEQVDSTKGAPPRVVEMRLGELFCGPGGLALGAGLADQQQAADGTAYRISHAWGVDKDGDAIATFGKNIVNRYGGCGYHLDVNEFCGHGLEERTPIDALAFGFPCNDFSTVGERKGLNGDYGLLYQAGVAVLKRFSPLWFVAENVSGIAHAETATSFRKIIQELRGADGKSYGGYRLTINLYKFEDYGVPQARHRYIIVGVRRDQRPVFRVPRPTHGNGGLARVTAQEALAQPFSASPANDEMAALGDRVRWRLIFTPPGENAWKLDEIVEWPDERLLDYLKRIPWYNDDIAPLGSVTAMRAKIGYAKLNVKAARMSHIYKRLVADQPSYTVTGSGGGGTHIYHWAEHRSLTNRERARLQSFPDSFEFVGGRESVRKQIGMAVPPMGAKVIFEAILKTFAGIDYPSVKSNWPEDDDAES